MRVLGVDACRAGWVGIALRDGRFAGGYLRAGLAALLADAPAAEVVGVDMPVGLLEHGWRSADVLAAQRIGARRSSVFRVPPRAAWACGTYAEANRVCRKLTGAGFSVQAYRLRAKLLEAEAVDGRLYEVHPEVSFRELAGAPLAYPKRTWAGHTLRRSLLAGAGIVLPDELGPAGPAGPDDVLDAAVAAWTAGRIARGDAVALPEPAQFNERGQRLAIWY